MPTGRAGGGGGGSVLRERGWLNMVMRTYMTVTPA
jgi:hypothetical protein